jgi:hypothetical protein
MHLFLMRRGQEFGSLAFEENPPYVAPLGAATQFPL